MALTDEFGDRLRHVPIELYAYGRAMETWNKIKDGNEDDVNQELVTEMKSLGIESLPESTREGLYWIWAGESTALVLGFGVKEEDLDQVEVVSRYRAHWDALVQNFPTDIQSHIQTAASITRPRVHVLTGRA